MNKRERKLIVDMRSELYQIHLSLSGDHATPEARRIRKLITRADALIETEERRALAKRGYFPTVGA